MPENQDAVFPLLLLNPELDWKGTEKIKVQIIIASLHCTLYVITVCSLYSLSAFRCNFYTVCPTCYRTRHYFNNSNTNEKLSIGYFQQDGATSHTSHASMTQIQSFFGDGIIINKF